MIRPAFVHFAEVLAARAAEHPDQVSFRFLGDTAASAASLTTAALDRRARELAALLQADAGSGARALLLCPPGLDYIVAFYACLYAGTIAAPAYPPSPIQFAGSLRQLESVARTAGVRFVLSTTSMLAARNSMQPHAPALCGLRWIAVDGPMPEAADDWRPPPLAADAIALLQYTSGSPGAPKGVMVTHRNLLHNTLQLQRVLRGGPGDRHVCWLPPYHNMGLIAHSDGVALRDASDFVHFHYAWFAAIGVVLPAVVGGLVSASMQGVVLGFLWGGVAWCGSSWPITRFAR